jgi:AAA domain/UvrD-like helicase C-terminal domain
MGKVIVYTGQAGTGKTYSLMQLLTQILPQREWQKYEAVLALTFMHGSRKRLESNLKFVKSDFKVKCECSTIDSFALNILNRFRSYLNLSKPISVSLNGADSEGQFEIQLTLDTIHNNTINLLNCESVKAFISNSYPYIIIDEFQDCNGTLLGMVKLLTSSTNVLIAADPFQQLSNTEECEGMNWILENEFEVIDLDAGGVKRTKNNKILNTATCLRKGENINGTKVYITPSVKALTSYFLKTNIYYNIGNGNIAIISPTMKSKFVKDGIDSLSTTYTFKKGKHDGKTIGPYNTLLGSDGYANVDELLIDIPKRPLNKLDLKNLKTKNNFILNRCCEKSLKKMTLRNLEEVSYDDFIYTLNQFIHTHDNFYRKERFSKLILTTIHGAKNREFDTVIILWPYEVSGNTLYKRKLLYNAITRAKTNAIIIVQNKTMDLQTLAEDDLFGLIIEKE